ncbi:MAG: metal-dependent transcriptional regulator [Candidatus Cloacimonetes bacterium]|nr:metal-dependent transcriptional regulator [Candidatus Cloacimonadota bacterium]
MRTDLYVLGESLEDYLEEIMLATKELNKVRVTDIADRMGVKKSSVNSAMKKLVSEGYVNHEKYGDIGLTKQGEELAEQIYQRHKSLKLFLTEILNVNEKTAALNACTIEHYLNEETYRRFMYLYDFFQEEENSKHLLSQLREYIQEKSDLLKASRSTTTIKHLRIGETATIKGYALDTDPEYKSKLLRMGLIKNTKLKVVRVAPLGDPIEISINNYHIILRKEEAKCVEVELSDE